jgi:hypothetical protein
MNNPMREHLIGYLLDAVEPDERTMVEKQLQQDEGLRREADLLRSSLHPLSCDAKHHAPPPGLAQRCCQYVYSRVELMPAALSPVSGAEYGKRRRWSWLDLSVAGAIAAAVSFLMVPAIYQSHIHSQVLGCQNNLKEVGAALASYSDRHGGYYPTLAPQQSISAAALVSQGYLPNSAVVCPSSTTQNDDQSTPIALPEKMQEVKWDDMGKVLSHLGSYGYTLGFRDGNKLVMQRNQHRTEFPLASDLPGNDHSNHPTNSPNHGGSGQNVLFEDGHVEYLNSSKTASGDDIFRNADGEVAPGTNENDSVIVPVQEPTN